MYCTKGNYDSNQDEGEESTNKQKKNSTQYFTPLETSSTSYKNRPGTVWCCIGP